MEEVIKIIESKKKWEIDYISNEYGYRRPGAADPVDAALGRVTVIGEKSISVFIGEYRNLFITSVTVFWGFNKNSKLVGVHVWKVEDSL